MNALLLALVLFVPDDYDASRKYPLVLFLHGGGGRGTDGVRHLQDGNGMLVRLFIDRRFPAFVLAPQTATEHVPGFVLPLVDEVIKKYSIDGRRIYVVGQSLGGYGALDVMAARPRQFAAAVIIATGGNAADVKDLSSIPMWFFHGERDEVIPVAEARGMVGALKAAGGKTRYTEYKGEEHGLAWLVVRERGLVPWLYAQRRR